jgi:hypothetical protein
MREYLSDPVNAAMFLNPELDLTSTALFDKYFAIYWEKLLWKFLQPLH